MKSSLCLLLALWSQVAISAELRFESIRFSPEGVPMEVTCRIRVAANLKLLPQAVLISSDALHMTSAHAEIIARDDRYYELRATLRLSAWVDLFSKVAPRDWKMRISGELTKMPDDGTVVELVEVGKFRAGLKLVDLGPEKHEADPKESPPKKGP